MATLDELVVRIKADTADINTKLDNLAGNFKRKTDLMGNAAAGLKSQLATLIPAITIAGVVAFTKNAVAAADALNDLAARTGTSASFLGAMREQIENAGGSVEGFASALQFMNNSIGEAARGNEAAAEAFTRLGVSIEELKALSPEEQFLLLSQRISELGTQYERTEAARNIFGRGIGALLPVLTQGADAIQENIDKAREFGFALGDEQLQAIDDFGDGLNSLAITAQNLAAGAFANLVIGLQQIGEGIRCVNDQLDLGADGRAYIEKARAGGFATEITRGDFISKTPYGPNAPARRSTPAAASAERKQAKREIDDLTVSTMKLNDSMDKVGESGVVSAKLIKDSFGDALETAVFEFENFGDSVNGILEGIARNIVRAKLINPLSDALGDLIDNAGSGGGGGFLSDIFGGFFADGGRPPTGKVSVVGENGPELFVPDSAGTVVPNGGFGRTTVAVYNSWNISPGVQGTVRKELLEAAPAIISQSVSATMAAIEKGGRSAQIVGKRT